MLLYVDLPSSFQQLLDICYKGWALVLLTFLFCCVFRLFLGFTITNSGAGNALDDPVLLASPRPPLGSRSGGPPC